MPHTQLCTSGYRRLHPLIADSRPLAHWQDLGNDRSITKRQNSDGPCRRDVSPWECGKCRLSRDDVGSMAVLNLDIVGGDTAAPGRRSTGLRRCHTPGRSTAIGAMQHEAIALLNQLGVPARGQKTVGEQ